MADVELLQPNMLVKNKAGEWRVIAYVNFDTDDGRPVVHYRTQFLPEFAEDVQLADPKDLELVEFYELCRRFRSNYHSWRHGQTLFNVLAMIRPDLSEQIRATPLDPFYLDERITDFNIWLEKNWLIWMEEA